MSWGKNARGSWQNNDYHEHGSAKVKDAIKRYSREANVDIGPIKMKHFTREIVGEHSLVNSAASDSTKFKYGFD